MFYENPLIHFAEADIMPWVIPVRFYLFSCLGHFTQLIFIPQVTKIKKGLYSYIEADSFFYNRICNPKIISHYFFAIAVFLHRFSFVYISFLYISSLNLHWIKFFQVFLSEVSAASEFLLSLPALLHNHHWRRNFWSRNLARVVFLYQYKSQWTSLPLGSFCRYQNAYSEYPGWYSRQIP